MNEFKYSRLNPEYLLVIMVNKNVNNKKNIILKLLAINIFPDFNKYKDMFKTIMNTIKIILEI
jgi:hypothetical protein